MPLFCAHVNYREQSGCSPLLESYLIVKLLRRLLMYVCTALSWQREAGTNTRKARKRSVKIQNKTPTRAQTDPCVRGIPPAQHKPAAEEAEAPHKTFFFTDCFLFYVLTKKQVGGKTLDTLVFKRMLEGRFKILLPSSLKVVQ